MGRNLLTLRLDQIADRTKSFDLPKFAGGQGQRQTGDGCLNGLFGAFDELRFSAAPVASAMRNGLSACTPS
jgi:hypothetical protein